jgi:ribosomal protein S18 acetylase RimI-like enzyme
MKICLRFAGGGESEVVAVRQPTVVANAADTSNRHPSVIHRFMVIPVCFSAVAVYFGLPGTIARSLVRFQRGGCREPSGRAVAFPRTPRGDMMRAQMELDGDITIRSFQPGDLAACQQLYREGMIGGQIAENDTGLDIDDIDFAYIRTSGNHFWVAVNKTGEVVGMIGVMHSDGVGEIRRLRVRADHRRRGIGSSLLETAVRFCQERNYLKVALDTFTERDGALKLFEKFRFRHGRTRSYAGKDLLYFYLDLYTSERKEETE